MEVSWELGYRIRHRNWMLMEEFGYERRISMGQGLFDFRMVILRDITEPCGIRWMCLLGQTVFGVTTPTIM
ncbi:MAG: hypothetical protein EBT03_08450 [Betaproteobacteria bacterium]|nr:hypothetical protein [Betaproteobacteria bacterium]